MSSIDFNYRRGVKKLSVVIPVFNNAESLPELSKRLVNLTIGLRVLSVEIELIFVDDGSSDNSYQVLSSLDFSPIKVKLVRLIKNFGAVSASRTGVTLVSGDMFTILAADLQDPPELILEMVREWKDGNKFVICERRTRKDPTITKFFSQVHYFFVRHIVFKSYPRGGFDMALIDGSLLATINSSVKTGSVPYLAFSLGYTPKVIKYDRPERLHGVSGWTFWKKFNFFLDLLLGYSNKPIRLISGLGVVVSFASFSYGVAVVGNAAFNQISVPGFAALAALISFLIGVQLLMLGIIGEYLWRIYEQVNNRPISVIESVREI